MTYKQRMKKICATCQDKRACAYFLRHMETKCTYVDSAMTGWEHGCMDTIEEVEKIVYNTTLTDEDRVYEIQKLIKKIKDE